MYRPAIDIEQPSMKFKTKQENRLVLTTGLSGFISYILCQSSYPTRVWTCILSDIWRFLCASRRTCLFKSMYSYRSLRLISLKKINVAKKIVRDETPLINAKSWSTIYYSCLTLTYENKAAPETAISVTLTMACSCAYLVLLLMLSLEYNCSAVDSIPVQNPSKLTPITNGKTTDAPLNWPSGVGFCLYLSSTEYKSKDAMVPMNELTKISTLIDHYVAVSLCMMT